ncbi:MAG TPA: GTP-sensing pleiotropic transcriptional regulator CodY [Eubacteriaceae bacterium]|nr:GTP-sensing pleiotropic transcriptional regulator CodY [Eubacteriaceae bacterium]
MTTLLEKIRKVNRVLELSEDSNLHFANLSKILTEVMECNVYIASTDGKLIGYSFAEFYDCELNLKTLQEQGTKFPSQFNEFINTINDTVSNKIDTSPECVYDHSYNCQYSHRYSTYVPINSGGERLGTLVLAKFSQEFTEEDLILAEVSATVVGMEMMRIKNYELEKNARERTIVQMAVATLSYSEIEAVHHIFDELKGDEGLLVASKIADRAGITRSVIVNALRKFESAGVIETRSLGMKGTFIKILNDHLFEELQSLKN